MRKSILIFLFTLLGVFSAHAYDFEVDGIYYNIISDTSVEVTYGAAGEQNNKYYTGLIVVPSTVEYDGTSYHVTVIGPGAFAYCQYLYSVTIPEGVTSIGARAFYESMYASLANIPESVTSIGRNAFFGSLQKLVYNSKIFFYMPAEYNSVYTIPSGIQSIAPYAFENCRLTSVTIPESVTVIGAGAFYKCSRLTSVTIPESVTVIGAEAFYKCSRLTLANISESVTSIGESAFAECTGLTSVTISEGVTDIGSSAFEGCTGLTSVTIPESVTSIGESAFAECTGLTSVTISEGVTDIGSSAFEGCTGLTSVTIPESVTSIGHYAFRGCTSISSPLYNSKIFAYMPPSYSGEYMIPSGIQSIAPTAFLDSRGLTSVTIPESMTSIGYSAFYKCSSLVSVTIPNSVTSIGESAFAECTGLTSVTIPNSVTSIGESAFAECTGLTSVVWNAVDCYFNGFYIPFRYCANITAITFGNQVARIPNHVFSCLWGLESVTIPNSVTSIGDYAFEFCSSLASVTIGENVDSIGYAAFRGCDTLLSVISLAKRPPHCKISSYGTFSNLSATLFVPRDCKKYYRVRNVWREFTTIYESGFDGTGLVTVQANDSAMGRVTGGGEYEIDEEITLEAIPNEGYHFVKWDDGNTDNPRTLKVTADITLTAIFAKEGEEPTANENAEADNFRVYVQDRTIYLSEDRGVVQVYNMAGQCVYNGHATAIPVKQGGVYVLVANDKRIKVAVK